MAARISVLVPCFNDGAYLADAIASVRAQTCQDFEIVIVDDGSTDPATRSAVDALAGPGVRVLRTANRGLPAARNHAAAHASGGIFCALDADDRLAPEWFEKALAVLDSRPDVSFVSHWLETFGDERWTWTPERCDLPSLLARNAVNGAALVRREAFEQAGGYDETMREGCEDWDFWLRLVERGHQGHIIPEVLFFYRRRAESMSRVMLDEAAYRRPLQTLVTKHADAYREHLVEVLVAKEREALHLSHEIAELERKRLIELEPQLRRAREEHAAMEAKRARGRQTRQKAAALEHLTWKTGELEREVRELRASWSWRITAPLRWLFERFGGGTR